MAPVMGMAQFVHDPVEERKVHESTPNEQPKHEHLVIEKYYECQWSLCDRVFVGLEDLLNHALDVHGFDEEDGEESDKVSVITLKEEDDVKVEADEQSIEQVNPMNPIESTLDEINNDEQSIEQVNRMNPIDSTLDEIVSDGKSSHSNLDQFNPNPNKFDSDSTKSTSSNQSKSNSLKSQPVSSNLNQFCVNLDQSSHSSIQPDTKSNSTLVQPNLTIIPPITLSEPTTSKRTSQFKKFQTHKDIILHYSNSVNKKFKFPCEECKKIINRNYSLVFLMSHLRTYHGINLDQLNSHGFNPFLSQPVSVSLDQFSANLEQFSPSLNQFNINTKFISKPMNLSVISSTSTSQSNLDVDDQQFGNDDELLVNGLSGITNSALILTTTIEINGEYTNEEVITLHSNEGSSLHSSPTQSQPSSQQTHQECNLDEVVDDDGEFFEDNWDVEVKSIVRPAFKIIDKKVEESGKMMDNDQNEEQDKEHDRDCLATGNNLLDLSVANGQIDGDMSENDHHVGNDEELLMDDQVSDDEVGEDGVEQLNVLVNDQMESDGENDDNDSEGPFIIDEDATEVDEDDHIGVDQLNRLEHQTLNIEREDAQGNKFLKNIHSAQFIDKSHTGKRVCEHCGEGFKMPFTLNRHMRIHTSIQSVPSPSHRHNTIPVFGSKSYPNERKVTQLKNDKVGAVFEEYDWDGQHGDDQLNGLDHRSNIENAHGNKLTQNLKSGKVVGSIERPTGKHVCGHCGKTYKVPSKLAIHTRTHTGYRPFPCTWDNCGKTFKTHSELKRHTRIHTGDKQFRCTWDNCGKSFIQNGNLKSHMRIHTGEKPHKCPWKDCTEVFTYDRKMRQHFMVHVDKTPFKCPWEDCHKEFTRIREFRVHVKNHTEKIALPEKSPTGECICEHCARGFKRRFDLNRHIRTHTGERPYECSFEGCNMRFALINSMRTHYLIHTGMRPHVCNHCRRGFQTSSNLTRHNRIHTGERPYECPHCRRTFFLKNALKKHILIHTGERAHVCEQCRKAFKTKTDLKKHSNVHRRKTVEVNDVSL